MREEMMSAFVQVCRTYDIKMACEISPVYLVPCKNSETAYVLRQLREEFGNCGWQGIFPESRCFVREYRLETEEVQEDAYQCRYCLEDASGIRFSDFFLALKQILLSEHKQNGIFLLTVPSHLGREWSRMRVAEFWQQVVACKKKKNVFVMLVEDGFYAEFSESAHDYANVETLTFPLPEKADFTAYLERQLLNYGIDVAGGEDGAGISERVIEQIDGERLDFSLLERLAQKCAWNYALREESQTVEDVVVQTMETGRWHKKEVFGKKLMGFEVD